MKYKRKRQIALFFDTNVLFDARENLTNFEFGETYERIKSFIKINNYNQFIIIIPRIVIEELHRQKIEGFISNNGIISEKNNSSDKFFEAIRKLGYSIEIKKNKFNDLKSYKIYIKKEKEDYIRREKGNFIIVEYNDINYLSIIRRSIDKRYPFFEGKGKKDFSDAGFKDVIFLESIKKYLKKNNCEFIIFSNDNILLETKLYLETKNRIGEFKGVIIGNDIIEHLTQKYNLKDYSEYILFVNNAYFDESVEEALKCKILEKSNDIYEERDESDNVIYNVNTKVTIDDNNEHVTVVFDENKNLILAKRTDSNEIIYSW